MKKASAVKTALSFLLLFSTARAAASLTLEDYLVQVRATGPNYLQAVTNRKTIDLSRLLLAKHWNVNLDLNASGVQNYQGANYNYEYTGLNSGFYQSFSWNQTQQIGFNGFLNLSNQWDFGLNTSLSENFQAYNVRPSYDSSFNTNVFNDAGDNFNLSVSVPLWQNFLGRSIHAQDQRDYLSNDAARVNDEFQIEQAVYTAKTAYFNLALVRAERESVQEALEKYQELLDWAKARHSSQDELQAETALETEQLNLESLEDAERADRDAFNLMRGAPGSAVEEIESLEGLNAEAKTQWDPEDPRRLDLESARLQLESARQSIVVAEEGTKLDLELEAGLNGSLVENDFGYPAPPPIAYPNLQGYSAGLSLNVPFDIFTSRWDASLKTGRLNVAQQEVLFQSAQNSDSQQWEDMTIRYNKSEDRIAAATQLMEKSKQKRDQGRDLLKRGRVDLFEELSFVNAYVSSVGVRQTWIAQRLSLLAQADWYRAGPGDGAAK